MMHWLGILVEGLDKYLLATFYRRRSLLPWAPDGDLDL